MANPVQTFQAGMSIGVQWPNGLVQRLVLDAPIVTIVFTDPSPQDTCRLLLQQGAGGSTLVWPANVKWPNATPIVPSAGAGAVDLVEMIFDGANYYVSSVQNNLG